MRRLMADSDGESPPQPQYVPVPFDQDEFVREEKYLRRPAPEVVKPKPEVQVAKKLTPEEEYEQATRPTGYARWEQEDFDEEEEVRKAKMLVQKYDEEDSVELEDYTERSDPEKLLIALSNGIKDLFVDGEYDSRRWVQLEYTPLHTHTPLYTSIHPSVSHTPIPLYRRKSARGVFKSITLLSFLIGGKAYTRIHTHKHT